jgi:hypothetical protein
MKVVIADQKKRLVLPDARPGDAFQVEYDGPDHYRLRRLALTPVKRRPRNVAAVKEAMHTSPLQPTASWPELRRLTREP